MVGRFAVPFLILAVLFLPWPLVPGGIVFSVLLAARPRGETCPVPACVSRRARPALVRGPPR